MPTLSEERDSASNIIDFAAGACRSRFITNVTGQTETYAAKAKQAQEYADAKYDGLAPPYVVGEAEATGLTFKAAGSASGSRNRDGHCVGRSIGSC